MTETENNQGAYRLEQLANEAGSMRALAHECGENEGQLRNYLRGRRKPGIDVRRRLQRSLGIGFDLWDRKPRGVGG